MTLGRIEARSQQEDTGLEFEAGTGLDSENQRWYLLRPRGLLADLTSSMTVAIKARAEAAKKAEARAGEDG